MFEDYLVDASAFIESARGDEDLPSALMYYRAAVLSTAASAEAFVNYIADTLAYAHFEAYEIAFLSDVAFGLDNAYVLNAQDKQEFHKLEDKIKLLLAKFPISYDRMKEPSWSQFLALKMQRDKIIHLRHQEELLSRIDYDGLFARGLTATIDLMNRLSVGILGAPLRKQLLA
jgi:hypothetical protein